MTGHGCARCCLFTGRAAKGCVPAQGQCLWVRIELSGITMAAVDRVDDSPGGKGIADSRYGSDPRAREIVGSSDQGVVKRVVWETSAHDDQGAAGEGTKSERTQTAGRT